MSRVYGLGFRVSGLGYVLAATCIVSVERDSRKKGAVAEGVLGMRRNGNFSGII